MAIQKPNANFQFDKVEIRIENGEVRVLFSYLGNPMVVETFDAHTPQSVALMASGVLAGKLT